MAGLSNLGLRLRAVALVVEALDIIKQWPPDLILLDLMMPRMDGLTLLDRLNQMREMEFVPRIVVSSRTDTESMASSMSKGVVAYMTKPIEFDILAPTILEALGLELLSPELDQADA